MLKRFILPEYSILGSLNRVSPASAAHLMATLLDSTSPSVALCAGEFGRFENGGREFLITDPRTPTPWTNVLANERYGLVLSQAGAGFSWFENCQLFRLSRWNQDLVEDRQGRFVYLRDLDTGDVWSTTLQPTLVDASVDQVRHGPGYTIFTREVNGIESECTVFVPRADSCEVWILRLRNNTARQRRIRFASYVDWHLGSAGDVHREFHRLFIETRTVGTTQLAWKHAGLIENERTAPSPPIIAFHSVNGVDIAGWTSGKADFLGRPARLESPAALFDGPKPGNGRWEDPIASAMGDLVLEPGQAVSFTLTLGATEDSTDALRLAAKYSLEESERALQEVKQHWEKICQATTLKTGAPAIDVMVNYWLPYQTIASRMTARCAYYQQGGAYGFRDQLQDSLALLPIEPDQTKKQLLIHAEATYEDGGVRHWWHPGTSIYAESKHSDTCLWLAFGTLAYLDETADLSVLDTECAYLNWVTQAPGERASWLDHCLRGIQRSLDRRSPRGLPLILAGDWNDGLSHAGLDGTGESVWVGMFLFDILRRWATILPEIGLSDLAKSFAQSAEELRSAVNEFGWDGEWYLEGTCDDGRPLGSHENTSGQIFLNPQTWAVITGIAPEDRARKALNAAKERLIKPYGALLLQPAYSHVDPWVGYITRYAPGSRENGGVYSHASTWAVQALAMRGDAQLALDLYRGMLPSGKPDHEMYAAEPYVMPGNVDGPDSPNEGRAGWTWYTGSSAWMLRVAYDWICGVRATREGLLVNPPDNDMGDFGLSRKFRGDRFDIHVEGSGPNIGMTSPTAEICQDNMLLSTGQGACHQVRVRRS